MGVDENNSANQPYKEYFELEEIPEIVFEELKKHYKGYTLDNLNKPVTSDCVTRAFQVYETISENTWSRAVNKDFEPIIALNVDKVRSFKLRGIFYENFADIYAIGQIVAIKHRPDTKFITVEEFSRIAK